MSSIGCPSGVAPNRARVNSLLELELELTGSVERRAHAVDAATTSTMQMRMRIKQPAAERLAKFGAEGITRVDAA